MLNFHRTIFDLKGMTTIAVNVTGNDELHVQLLAKNNLLIDQKIPVKVDVDYKDLVLALKNVSLDVFKKMGINISKINCTVHYNQLFILNSDKSIELVKSEREIYFDPDFDEEIISMVCFE